MLTLECPCCGAKADETELAAGSETHLKRKTIGASDEAFESYLFDLKNSKAAHFRRWRHAEVAAAPGACGLPHAK